MGRQRGGLPTQGHPTLPRVGEETRDEARDYPLFELALLMRLRTPDTKAGSRGRGYVSQIRVFVRLCAHMHRGCTSITLLVCSNGYLLMRCDDPGKPPIMKQVPWFQNPQKEILAVAFDPSGRQAVCACRDSSVYVIPVHNLLHPTTSVKHSWNAGDLTRILVTSKRGMPTQVVWWNSSDGRSIVIIGTEDGEVALIDLAARKAVKGVSVKEIISRLDIVYDPRVTYLLIQGDSGTQWGLLLEKHSTSTNTKDDIGTSVSGFEVIHPGSVPRQSILYSHEGQTSFLPYCFHNFMDIVTLSTQLALGHNFVAALDYASNIFKIFDSSIDNWTPLHVYRLPPKCSHVVLTDRLMFVIYSQDSDMIFGVLSSHLSETTNQDRPLNQEALMQKCFLPSEEKIISMHRCSFPAGYLQEKTSTHEYQTSASQQSEHEVHPYRSKTSKAELCTKLESHTALEGCVLVTDVAVYQCRPRISPEGLFMELAKEELDTPLPDNLGVTLGLDMNGLYELAANRRLVEGRTKLAMRLYRRSNCSQLKQVSNFVSQGYIQEALNLILSALTRQADLSTADKRQLADTAIKCYLHQVLEGRSDEALIGKFRDFLRGSFDYNEISTMELFAKHSMQDLVFEVARSRGLVDQALDALLTYGSPELQSDQQCLLISQGFISSMVSAGDNAFLMSMTAQEAVNRLVEKPELSYRYMELFSGFLEDLKLTTLMKLAWLFDPSKPTIRPLLTRAVSTAKTRTERCSSSVSLETSSSEGSVESLMGTGQSFPKPSVLVEFFLKLLIVLNRKRQDQGDFPGTMISDPNTDSSSPTREQIQQGIAVSLPPQKNILACGQCHVAMVSGDNVYTWGRAHGGRLGHGDDIPSDGRSAPFRVKTLHMHQIRIISVACGKEHTMALGEQGRLYSWGTSKFGQLGHGNQTTNTRPSLIQALTGKFCVAITCGQYHSLALTRDQKVFSWGWGIHGQLGHNSVEDQLQPRHVTALNPVRVISIAAGYCHSIMLSTTGQVYVCGAGSFGQLGLGKMVMKRTTPTLLDGFHRDRVTAISSGLFHSIAVAAAAPQRVFIWGKSPLELRQSLQSNRKRKTSRDTSIGDTVVVSRRRSVTVMESRFDDENQYLRPYAFDTGKICAPIKQVACSMNHNLILTANGQLYSFGKNDSGQLGLGHRTEQRIPVLVRMSEEHCIAAIGAGSEFSVAITSQGQVFSWGSPENGQLGINATNRAQVQIRPGLHINTKASKTPQLTRLTVTPALVPGIPLVPIASALESNSMEEESDEDDMESSDEEEEETPDWNLPNLSCSSDPSETPYGPESLTLSLKSLDGHYNHQTTLQHCHDKRIWHAAADISELDRNYPLALLYRLKERKERAVFGGSEEKALEEMISLVDKYIRSTCQESPDEAVSERDATESCKLLLIQILQFWMQQDLPQDSLEKLLREHMDNIAYPLSVLLLCDGTEPAAGISACIVPPKLFTRFSTKFCLEVTSAVVQQVNEGKPCEDYKISAATGDQTTTKNNTLASIPKGHTYGSQGADGTVSSDRLWEEVLHNLSKDVQARAHVTITKTEAAGLVDSSSTNEKVENSLETSDSVVFTCGHHYKKRNLQDNVVPSWVNKMAALPVPLPKNTQSLASQYTKGDGLIPMACPNCVHSSLQSEQLKQVSST